MQVSVFDSGSPAFDPQLRGLERLQLGHGAWIDYLPNWLQGHQHVFLELARTAGWVHQRRVMYERTVDVPRLTASAPSTSSVSTLLAELSETLSAHYGVALESVSLAWYRNGQDSVAFHGDKVDRLANDTIVAIVSVGAPRRFLLRPVQGGRSKVFSLGWGDLLVMGGTCQRTWQHGVPKIGHADPRISIMFRENLSVNADSQTSSEVRHPSG